MSPLIATVLLIAFAVALGAMIMNWAPMLGEDRGPDCSDVTMIINPFLCYGDNIIKISVKNTGKAVEAVTLKLTDQNIENEIKIKDSALQKGMNLMREIPYVKPSGDTYVALVPSIEHKGEIVECPDPVIEIPELPRC